MFGLYLPGSNGAAGAISRFIRRCMAVNFMISCGTDVNICARARIGLDISLGDHSGIGERSRIENGVAIGNDVMMGPECYIYTMTHSHTRIDIPMRLQGYMAPKTVVIGNDVWIGARVTILPGVMIGDGTIVGAGAVVSKNTPPYSVVVGNPARVVKMRDASLEGNRKADFDKAETR